MDNSEQHNCPCSATASSTGSATAAPQKDKSERSTGENMRLTFDHRPVVAFVCVHNSCRSQIAEALGKLLASASFESVSAGTELKDMINQDAVRLVKARYGIDMEAKGQRSKLVAELPAIDIVITMGCNVACPLVPHKYLFDWGLEDPSGHDDAFFNHTIDSIEHKIRQLAASIVITSP